MNVLIRVSANKTC